MFSVLITLAAATAPLQAKPATNILCPVAACELDKDSPTLVVRGQEYRLCCDECNGPLLNDPDMYLNGDGTPKNTPKGAPKPESVTAKT